MNNPRSPWWGLLIAVIILPFTAYAVFWISLFTVSELDESWHPAWMGDSSGAEIIVYTPDNSPYGFSAKLLATSTTQDFVATHPGTTFLLPPDRQSQIQEHLQKDLQLHWNNFEIKQLSGTEEQITFFFMDRTDDSFGSRYIATKNGFQLKSYRYIDDRAGMGAMFFAVFLTAGFEILLIGGLAIRAVYLWRKRRKV